VTAGDAQSIVDSQIAAAARAVAATPVGASVLLCCHVNPDGDALGSMLGFGLGLRQLGYTGVRASFPEPFAVTEPFQFLPGLDLLVPPELAPSRPALAISFDAASPARLGPLAAACGAAPHWLMLDHHISNPGFGTHPLVRPGAAATAVVAADLLAALSVSYDPQIATCLYVALATDTGSFRFDATTAEVFSLAATLVAAGAEPAMVARHVFDTRSFGAVRLLAAVLQRAELDPDLGNGRGLVSAYATPADLTEFSQPAHVLESFIDVLRTTTEADVACLLKPAAPGEWAVSLRSKGDTDVASVAVGFGGGGHRLAAGFTGRGDAVEILAAVRKQLDAAPWPWPVPGKDID
jgi:bifunctional oligoribonuclease and PAP phosphatase NrnA